MRLVVNGEELTLAAPTTLSGVVSETLAKTGRLAKAGRADATRGVAVAVNLTVVPRNAWESTTLADGDEVEILTAVQGG